MAALVVAVVGVAADSHHDKARSHLVARINNNPTSLWKATSYERFQGKEVGYSKNMLGLKEDFAEVFAQEVRDGKVQVVTANAETVKDIPDTFDAAVAFPKCNKTISDIRDQSDCGCCPSRFRRRACTRPAMHLTARDFHNLQFVPSHLFLIPVHRSAFHTGWAFAAASAALRARVQVP